MASNRIERVTVATRENSTTHTDARPSFARRLAWRAAWFSVGGALALSCPFWPSEIQPACEYAAKLWDIAGGLIGA